MIAEICLRQFGALLNPFIWNKRALQNEILNTK
jgi:hypothetical protein